MQQISGAQLTVLIFHRVPPNGDVLDPSLPDACSFERCMRLLAGCANVMPLREALDRLNSGRLPARAAAITFDDGYADNATVAVPILEKLGLSATFFIATGFLDGGRMWNDTIVEAVRTCRAEHLDLSDVSLGMHPLRSRAERIAAIELIIGRTKYLESRARDTIVGHIARRVGGSLPRDLMMNRAQVRQLLNRGMDVGAHTISHPILAAIPDAQAQLEIVRGKSDLEEIIAAPVSLFAYPNGKPGVDYDARHVNMVRNAGFSGAVSTAIGAVVPGTDPLQIPRFTPWRHDSTGFALQFAQNLMRTSYETA